MLLVVMFVAVIQSGAGSEQDSAGVFAQAGDENTQYFHRIITV
jgi:hypothetical protein